MDYSGCLRTSCYDDMQFGSTISFLSMAAALCGQNIRPSWVLLPSYCTTQLVLAIQALQHKPHLEATPRSML